MNKETFGHSDLADTIRYFVMVNRIHEHLRLLTLARAEAQRAYVAKKAFRKLPKIGLFPIDIPYDAAIQADTRQIRAAYNIPDEIPVFQETWNEGVPCRHCDVVYFKGRCDNPNCKSNKS